MKPMKRKIIIFLVLCAMSTIIGSVIADIQFFKYQLETLTSLVVWSFIISFKLGTIYFLFCIYLYFRKELKLEKRKRKVEE